MADAPALDDEIMTRPPAAIAAIARAFPMTNLSIATGSRTRRVMNIARAECTRDAACWWMLRAATYFAESLCATR